jgi:ABC-2 type transport system permease protein
VLARVAAFEFRYLLRNPLLWATALAVFALMFAALAFHIGFEEDPKVFRNAPWEVVSKYRIVSCMFMFVTTAFVANAVLRDDETGFAAILRSTGLGKADYVFGRFLGAFAVAAACLALVSVGIWTGALVAGGDDAGIGPNRLSDHVYAYFLIGLPNVLITSAIFFALATVTRSMMATYGGLLVFLALYFGLMDALHGRPEAVTWLALAEPFSARAFGDATRYWTTPQRNAGLPPFAGALLWNRVLWVGIALAILAAAYRGFSFSGRQPWAGLRLRWAQLRTRGIAARADRPTMHPTATLPAPTHGPKAAWTLLLARTRFEAGHVLKSPAFVLLMAYAALLTLGVLVDARDPDGRPSWPLTAFLIPELEEIFVILPPAIVVIYSGELVWREREHRMHEIVDAAPHPDWAYLVPKVAAIALVLASMFAASAVAAMALQLGLGLGRLEPGAFALWYLLPMTWDAMLAAALAVLVQVLVPHKFAGWGVMLLYVAAKFTGQMPDHHLLAFAGRPPVFTSDMDGISSVWQGAWALRLYWGAGAVLLLVAAHLLWRRGAEATLRQRIRRASLRGGARRVAAGALLAFAGLGAFVFWNTNVLNRYEGADAHDAYWAEHEKRFLKHAALPQPAVSHVGLDIALYPSQRRATVDGRFVLRNVGSEPVTEVHVLTGDRALQVLAVAIDGARLASEDAAFGYRIFALDRPMAPGDTRNMTFRTQRWHRGFPNGAPSTRIVDNGTFLADHELLPTIGMSGVPKLVDAEARAKHGLPSHPGLPKLEDAGAADTPNGGTSWTTADITVSTSADQTPLAPGRKVADGVTGGRRLSRFVSRTPIHSRFSVQSARYARRHRRAGDVELAVYHHPAHAWNAGHMLDMLEQSLAYYESAFGPYPFADARIVEFPSYQYNFAQAFANTMPTSETIAFITDQRAPDAIDYVGGLVAHETAHQYWGQQLAPAESEGAMLLVETLAQYSGVMVLRRAEGEHAIRRRLRQLLDGYLGGRAWEPMGEAPLVRVGHQGYVMYGKGPLALYLLRDRLGEAAVNRALRTLLERHRFRGAPYARSVDLVALLRAEAKTPQDQALITDLFEKITLYDLKVGAPTAVRRADGRWEVTVPIDAKKLYADADGGEQEAPLDDRIPIGLFTAEPDAPGFATRDVVALERRAIRSGHQVHTFVVDDKPLYAGVDPYNLYIDRVPGDNVAAVAVDGAP